MFRGDNTVKIDIASCLKRGSLRQIADDICRLLFFKTNYHLERSLYVKLID